MPMGISPSRPHRYELGQAAAPWALFRKILRCGEAFDLFSSRGGIHYGKVHRPCRTLKAERVVSLGHTLTFGVKTSAVGERNHIAALCGVALDIPHLRVGVGILILL